MVEQAPHSPEMNVPPPSYQDAPPNRPVLESAQVKEGRDDEAIVVMRGVSKRFGEFDAVQDINLTVPVGGLVALIGPSGCGKTTTVRLLLGVYEPTTGSCQVFGQPSHHIRRPTRERIGYLPQQFVLYPTLTVSENLNFAAATYGLGPFRRRRQRNVLLELVGLAAHRNKLAGDISGGMQRRLMLAATLIHQPDLIFLDEPTAGIDPILREQLWQEFRNIQAQGRTQVVTTQYIAEAEYCDTVVLMDRGKIVASGPPDELRQQASGGDLIDVSIADLDRPMIARLRALRGVRTLRFVGDEQQLRLTVENASELIPQIIATVQESGSTVQAIEEHRLSFNDVFVALLKASGRDVRGAEEYGE
jgi:ABC-2 type transport system ATP-binding protein